MHLLCRINSLSRIIQFIYYNLNHALQTMIALFGVFDKLVPSGEALGPPAVDRGGLSLARRILTEVDGV